MLISRRHKFVFLGMPRTGSTSMYDAFRAALEDADYHGKHIVRIPPGCTSFYVAMFVRNPYAREVSHYLYRHTKRGNKLYPWAKDWTFSQYVQWSTTAGAPPVMYHDHTQCGWLGGARVDYVGRFEDLPRSFYDIPLVAKLGIRLPHKNANLGRRDWRPYYDTKTAARVYRWARDDFDRFGYDRNSWKPRAGQ